MYQWLLPISLHVANSLDPDPTRKNVGPDLDQNCLKPLCWLEEFFKDVHFELKISRWTTKGRKNDPVGKNVA